jgi:hypothetical protein
MVSNPKQFLDLKNNRPVHLGGDSTTKHENMTLQGVVIPAKARIQATVSFKTPGCRIESGMTENKLVLSLIQSIFELKERSFP